MCVLETSRLPRLLNHQSLTNTIMVTRGMQTNSPYHQIHIVTFFMDSPPFSQCVAVHPYQQGPFPFGATG